MSEFSSRPFRVTILAAFVLSITSWNAARAYSAMTNWNILREFGAPPDYIMTTGVIWAISGLWLAYVLWVGKRIAFGCGLTLAGLYLLWYWFDRLVMQPSPAPNLVFSVAVSVLLLVIFVLGMVWARLDA